MHLIIFDTEFTDFASPQLISIGALLHTPSAPTDPEDARAQKVLTSASYYAQCADFDALKTSTFVQEHVLPLLEPKSMPTAYALEYFVQFCARLNAPFMLAADSRWDEKVLLSSLAKERLSLPPHYKGFTLLQEQLTAHAYDRWQALQQQEHSGNPLQLDRNAFTQRVSQLHEQLQVQSEAFLQHQGYAAHHALHDAQALAFSFDHLIHQVDTLLLAPATKVATWRP